jgi:hypothetical protein
LIDVTLANDLALNFPKCPWISFLGNFGVTIFLKFEKGNAIQPLEVVRACSVKERCALFHIFSTKMRAFLVEKRAMCKKCARNMFRAHDKECSLVSTWLAVEGNGIHGGNCSLN